MRLLDTDVLSEVVKAAPRRGVVRIVQVLPAAYTSTVNVAELLLGVEKAGSQRLRDAYKRLVFPYVAVLPFDWAAAEHYARLRAHLERAGTPIGQTDMMVAAVALANQMTVVTGNVEHFARVPDLEVENWLE